MAVFDTLSADSTRDLELWRLYTETLYSQASRRNGLRTFAEPRIALHRSFAQLYGPRALGEPMDNDWEQKVSPELTLTFVANGWRVRSFVDQKLLEFISLQMRYESPSLTLGVACDDTPESRARAVEILTAFADEACRALPEHSRTSFLRVVSQRLQEAAKSLAVDSKVIRAELAWKRLDYAAAATEFQSMVEDDCQNLTAAANLITAATGHAVHAKDETVLDDLRKRIAEWAQRAREFVASWKPSTNESNCPLRETDITTIEEKLETNVRESRLQCQMKRAEERFNQGVEAAQRGQKDEMERCFQNAAETAGVVIAEADPSADQNLISRANDLLAHIKTVESQDAH